MADVITRFKLETTQYDSKLRDAAKSLSDYAKQATLAGNEFGKFTEKNVEAAKAFGNIATGATNSKDKVKELVSAFNTLAKTYNDLTQEQQQSDFGKAMAGSLNTLKGRIAEAKQELNSMGDSTRSTGGIMGMLKDKLTVNIDALKLFNLGLQGAKAALDVAKDAFFASEANVDEWGRVVASAQSVYEGFLTAINTGDISGYLNNINQIIQAARDAYDELDKLGTMKTIQGPQMSAQQTEINRMRMMLMTGTYIAPAEGSGQKAATGMKTSDRLTPEMMRNIERHLQNATKSVVDLTGREVKQAGKAIDAYYNKLAKQNGMTMEEFRKGVSSWAEFEKQIKGAERYAQYEREHTIYDSRTGISHRDRTVNPDEQYRMWCVFRVDKQRQNSLNDLGNLIKQRDQQMSQMYSTIGQAFRTINRAEGTTVKDIMGRGGKGGGGGRSASGSTAELLDPTSIAYQEKLVQDLTKKWREAGAAVRDEYKAELESAKAVLDNMKGIGIDDKYLNQYSAGFTAQANPNLNQGAEFKPLETIGNIRGMIFEDLNAELERLKELLANAFDPESIKAYNEAIDGVTKRIDELSTDKKQQKTTNPYLHETEYGKATVRGNEILGGIANGMQQMVSGIEQLGIELPEELKGAITVMQSISTILTGIATTVIAIEAISAADAFIPFAHGGIVPHAANGYFIPGTNYSGDRTPIMANAGELVLNRAQQGNLASQLEGGNAQGGASQPYATGEVIYLGVSNHLRRSGQGEIVTTSMLRRLGLTN